MGEEDEGQGEVDILHTHVSSEHDSSPLFDLPLEALFEILSFWYVIVIAQSLKE